MNRPLSKHALAGLDGRQNIAAGIGLMVLAVFLFAVNDTLGKWLAERYAAPQILLFRSIAALLVLAPVVGRAGVKSLVSVRRPRLQLLRAFLAAAETGMFYAAVAYLPLADTMTYYMAGPIYVTVLAAVFLGERVGWRRWSAILVGFIGVLIALQPGMGSLGWPTLIAFTGSIFYAIFLTVTRRLRGTPDSVMATWQIGAALVIGAVLTPAAWTPFNHWFDVVLLALLGMVALGAIVCVNRSLKLAPASVVVPYQYLMIVWAVIFGYVVFGDVPGWPVIVGAVIIIGAGLFIFFREQKLSLPSEPELPPER
jgi:drug/metabolite transporter (DMT)-like permease